MSRTSLSRRVRISTMTTLAALVFGAPVASARPVDPGYTSPTTSQRGGAVVVREDGFDWADAAIGAAAAAGLFGLTGAGVLVARRSREDANGPLGAY